MASADADIEKKRRREADAKRREHAKVVQESMTLEKQKKHMVIVETVAQFWDYEENQKRGFLLECVTFGRVYCWKCTCGHRWKSDLNNMLKNSVCPECYISTNSIAIKYPYIAAVYNINMNQGVPPEKCLAVGEKYYWWKCQKGHTFVATLGKVAMHKATGCMFCDKEKSYYSL